jgi:hypothetical protein
MLPATGIPSSDKPGEGPRPALFRCQGGRPDRPGQAKYRIFDPYFRPVTSTESVDRICKTPYMSTQRPSRASDGLSTVCGKDFSWCWKVSRILFSGISQYDALEGEEMV